GSRLRSRPAILPGEDRWNHQSCQHVLSGIACSNVTGFVIFLITFLLNCCRYSCCLRRENSAPCVREKTIQMRVVVEVVVVIVVVCQALVWQCLEGSFHFQGLLLKAYGYCRRPLCGAALCQDRAG
ncbi:unnamed protein product, partial [Polarella glacialis]